MVSLGAFGRFVTVFSLASRAVAFVAQEMSPKAAGVDKKAAAMDFAEKALADMGRDGRFPAEYFPGIQLMMDEAIELAYGIHKFGSAPAATPVDRSSLYTPPVLATATLGTDAVRPSPLE